MWCSACSCFHEIWNVPKEWIHFYKQIQEKCSCTRIKILIHPDSVKRLLGRKCQLSQSSCRIPAYFFLFKLLYSLTYSFIRERPHFSVFLPALCSLDAICLLAIILSKWSWGRESCLYVWWYDMCAYCSSCSYHKKLLHIQHFGILITFTIRSACASTS